MDPERARELLVAERKRIEEELAVLALTPSGEVDPFDQGDVGTDVFEEELDEGRIEELRAQLEAVERAEQRLAEGTYGISIESGKAIPDERLEIVPAAERTAEEQFRYEGHVV
jgi:DnaK suppressor protein